MSASKILHDYWTHLVIKQVIKSTVFCKEQKLCSFNNSYTDPEKGPDVHCLSGSYMTISGGEHKVCV